jgi:hypothetical protein
MRKLQDEAILQALAEAGEATVAILTDPKVKAFLDGCKSDASDKEFLAKFPESERVAVTKVLDRAEELARERGVSFD